MSIAKIQDKKRDKKAG
jgi:ATP-dependent RNA helicase DOB1